jgi:thymidylate synthase (FAD)
LALAREVYRERLTCGVAREQARKDLPLSTYTEAYWKVDLHNLLHFLSLRMDSHAQHEIQQYAKTIGEQIVKPLFPLVWEAFEDYRLNGMLLTGLDLEALSNYMSDPNSSIERAVSFIENKRERGEAHAKLERIVNNTADKVF